MGHENGVLLETLHHASTHIKGAMEFKKHKNGRDNKAMGSNIIHEAPTNLVVH